MRLQRSTVAVAASIFSLAGGGGVAWACTGGPGDPGTWTGTTGTTTTTTTGTTTTGTTTTTTAAAADAARRSHTAPKVRHHSRHTARRG